MKKKLTTYLTLVCFLFISSANAQQKFRVEKDLLGEKQVPADAYYGVQTARALENFTISGLLINHYPGFVEAWAIVKLAAARANTEVGAMKPDANIGLELTGHRKGKYQFLEPHDDLNMSQSTNDAYPTAVKVAFLLRNGEILVLGQYGSNLDRGNYLKA